MAEALIICRFLQFAALMLLFGASTFTGLLAPAGLRAVLAQSLRWPVVGLAVMAALTAVLWLGIEAGEIGGGWADIVNTDIIGSVLSDTAFGRVWVWRLLLAALLLIALLLKESPRRWAALLLSTLLLGSLGLVGHAAMEEGAIGWLHRLNQVLHLLAAGFWLGCLPPLLLCLPRFREPSARSDAARALWRFSGLGHFAVALVLATGFVNTALILGKPPIDFSSPYQTLLAVKIALVGGMIAIALCNRYVIVPRFPTEAARSHRRLVIGTVAELAIGAVVVALVSAFATFDPV